MQYIGIFNGNPTAGGTDGAEVSQNGVQSNPISTAIRTGTTTVKCAVRCAAGYVADGNITIKAVTKQNGGYIDGNDYVKLSTTQNGTYGNSITLSGVTAVNKLFYVKLSAGADAGTYTAGALRLTGAVTGA